MKKFSYQSMGTGWEITIWDDISDEKLADLTDRVFKMADDFDKTYSRFIKTSLVWDIANKGAGTYEVPEDMTAMLKIYEDLYEPSEKKLNPLIGFTISDMGYDHEYSLTPKDEIRQTPDLKESLKIIDNTHIELKTSALIDLGALGKGFFVDKIADFLKEEGLKKFLVNGSGDIFYQGDEPITVGLEDPADPSKVIGSIEMTTGAMCASGINRRCWREFHHVIDPISGKPTDFIEATWVVAEKAVIADALASCLFFVAPEALSKYQFKYWVLNNVGKMKIGESQK